MSTITKIISVGWGQTGLVGTIAYQVLDAADAVLIARTTSGIVESDENAGWYEASIATWDPTWSGKIVWDDGAGNSAEETFDALAPEDIPAPEGSTTSYLTVSEATNLAATLPGLASFKAASDAVKLAALILATADVDNGGPWQGRRYSTTQALEFPRVWRESFVAAATGTYDTTGVASVADGVWDWDDDADAAVVPVDVQRACLFQADAIIAGGLDRTLDALAQGVAAKSAGSVSVSYRSPAEMAALAGGSTGGLCRRAAQLMGKYRLVSGRMI